MWYVKALQTLLVTVFEQPKMQEEKMSGDFISVATITGKIHLVRDVKVLLVRDLADLYKAQNEPTKKSSQEKH